MKTRSGSTAALSVVVSAAMVIGMVVTATSTAAAEEPFDPTTFQSDELPALESEPLELPAPSIPEGVFEAEALAPVDVNRARSPQERDPEAPEPIDFDPSTAEIVSQDEFTNVYQVGEGLTATEIGQTPLNARTPKATGFLSTLT